MYAGSIAQYLEADYPGSNFSSAQSDLRQVLYFPSPDRFPDLSKGIGSADRVGLRTK